MRTLDGSTVFVFFVFMIILASTPVLQDEIGNSRKSLANWQLFKSVVGYNKRATPFVLFMIILASTPVFQDVIGNFRKSLAFLGGHWQLFKSVVGYND